MEKKLLLYASGILAVTFLFATYLAPSQSQQITGDAIRYETYLAQQKETTAPWNAAPSENRGNETNNTHMACVNSACMQVNGTGNNTCSTHFDCVNSSQYHLTCRNFACVNVTGVGNNTCSSNFDCQNVSGNGTGVNTTYQGINSTGSFFNQTHLACRNFACVSVLGAGANACQTNADCSNVTSYTQCVGMACVSFNGTGNSTCSTNNDCRHLDCINNSLCGYVAGGGVDLCQTSAECSNGTGNNTSGGGGSLPKAEEPPANAFMLFWRALFGG